MRSPCNYFLILALYLCLPELLISANPQKGAEAEKGQYALLLTDSCRCDSLLEANGVIINGKFEDIRSVFIPTEKLLWIQSLSCIRYSETGSRPVSNYYLNDTERRFSSVDRVNNGLANQLPKNYTGKGVIIGIVDIGFQCNNPTFYSSDGKRYRVSRYWQQNNNNGTPPSGFSYGREMSDSAAIDSANDMDGSHGTHVAGIAGGSGFTTPGLQFAGMAPEAELVFVSLKYSNDTLGGSALGDYVIANPTIIDAYNYIFNYAQSQGKPAVINLSWGMHTGPHDGTSLFDKATELLTGPGKILVGANGNEGENPMHISHQFNNDTVSTFAIENGRQWRTRESIYCDFWGSANTDFSVRVTFIDTNKNIVASTPFISSNSDSLTIFGFSADSNIFRVSLDCTKKNILNNKPNVLLTANHFNQRKYAIVLTITSANTLLHGWNSGATREWTSGSFRNKVGKLDFDSVFLDGNSDYTAGENGGTSKAVISVGALAARTSYMNIKGIHVNDSGYVVPGSITKFSSRGPTVDGRIKPDVSAPGYDVPSSVNNKRFEGWMKDKTLLKTVFRGDTQYWTAFNGTSMASPHVTGIVALLLQVKPDLDPAAMAYILRVTAAFDQFTGAVPNNQYGYGKVNAYAAVVHALQISDVNLLYNEVTPHLFPNPFDDLLRIDIPFVPQFSELEITGVDGKSYLKINHLTEGINELNTSSLAQGFFTLRLTIDGKLYAWKILKS